MTHEPLQARLLRIVWQLSGRKPRMDQFLAGFLKYRKYLPECDAADVIPNFSETEIHIRQCPVGAWSTPLIDVFVVIKAALGFRSRRILELGSYRGDTARLLAENTGDDVTICAVDVDEKHGASYRGLDVARKITRKTGRISPELFALDEKFDLIFVDADHDYASVMNDTEVAFKILAPEGVILWHDYRQDAYFHGMCGVPEVLNEFSKPRAIYAICGTMLAICSTCPNWETATLPSRISQTRAKTVWDEHQLAG
jgi:predicted O-methyltransferase YrrM